MQLSKSILNLLNMYISCIYHNVKNFDMGDLRERKLINQSQICIVILFESVLNASIVPLLIISYMMLVTNMDEGSTLKVFILFIHQYILNSNIPKKIFNLYSVK